MFLFFFSVSLIIIGLYIKFFLLELVKIKASIPGPKAYPTLYSLNGCGFRLYGPYVHYIDDEAMAEIRYRQSGEMNNKWRTFIAEFVKQNPDMPIWLQKSYSNALFLDKERKILTISLHDDSEKHSWNEMMQYSKDGKYSTSRVIEVFNNTVSDRRISCKTVLQGRMSTYDDIRSPRITVYYECLSLLYIPIIPLSCFECKMGSTQHINWKRDVTNCFVGREQRMSLLEVLSIVLWPIGVLLLFIFLCM